MGNASDFDCNLTKQGLECLDDNNLFLLKIDGIDEINVWIEFDWNCATLCRKIAHFYVTQDLHPLLPQDAFTVMFHFHHVHLNSEVSPSVLNLVFVEVGRPLLLMLNDLEFYYKNQSNRTTCIPWNGRFSMLKRTSLRENVRFPPTLRFSQKPV